MQINTIYTDEQGNRIKYDTEANKYLVPSDTPHPETTPSAAGHCVCDPAFAGRCVYNPNVAGGDGSITK